MSAIEPKVFEDTAEKAFKQLDGGSGSLKTDQIGEVMNIVTEQLGMSKPTPDDIETAKSSVDPDKTGSFSLTKFHEFIKEMFMLD